MQPNDIFMDMPTLGDCYFPPDRTQLYSVTPIGLGTPFQESLLSFLVRVSRAHAINPRRLIGSVLAKSDSEIGPLAYAGFFRKLAKTVNGLGDYAALFAAVLEKTTGTGQLHRLCLIPWRDLFPVNGQGMLAAHPQWCPRCLLEQCGNVGERYYPLAWAFAAFKVCPLHDATLKNRCPHCGKHQSFVPRYPDAGICSECGCFLVTDKVIDVKSDVPLNPQQRWEADALLSMVGRQASALPLPTVDDFRAFVLKAVDRHAAGNRAAFCRKMGLQARAVNGWLTKGEKPSMAQFLFLCYRLGVLPVDILPGNDHAGTATDIFHPQRPGRRRCRRLTFSQREAIQTRLDSLLTEEPGQPISSIAARLGITARSLRYWFPEQCNALTMRAHQARQDRSAQHQASQCRRVKMAVKTLQSTGRYPSRRQVNAILRNEGMALAQSHLLKAYRRAVAS